MVSTNRLPLVIFFVTAVFFIVPFFFMIYGAITPAINSRQYTLSYLVAAFTDPHLPTLLLNTIEFGAGGAAVALVLGTTYAWLMYRTDVPWKRFLGLLPIFDLTIPILVKGISWIFLFSPSIGLINIALMNIFGLSQAPFNIYSMAGLVFAWGISGVPFTYILMGPVFGSIESTLEESSRVSGAGVVMTLRKVTFPLVVPALVSTFLLWTIGGVENFDYPYILGQQGGAVQTLATKVYILMNDFETTSAASWGIIYLLIAITLVSVYVWTTRKSFRFVTVTGKTQSKAPIHKLGRGKWLGVAILLGIMTFAFFLPVIMILLVSLVPNYTVGGGVNPFAVLTLNNYMEALKTPLLAQSLLNSFAVTIGAGALATLIGSVMSYVLIKSKTRGRRILEYITYIPVAFPPLVYSVALIWTFLVIPLFNTYLYGTIWVMLIAITTLWIPYSVRFMSAIIIQLSDELEEAAAVTGSGWLQRFRKITLPVLKHGVVNSFIYVMVGSFREIGAVILLYNSGSVLFVLLVLNLFVASAATLPVVSALSMLMIVILSLAIIVTRVVTRTKFQF